jgi:hypothetical protein
VPVRVIEELAKNRRFLESDERSNAVIKGEDMLE